MKAADDVGRHDVFPGISAIAWQLHPAVRQLYPHPVH